MRRERRRGPDAAPWKPARLGDHTRCVPETAGPSMCGRWSVHCSVAALLFLMGGPHDAWSVAADRSTWIQLATSGTQPPGCNAHTAIYDSPFNRLIVFRGACGREQD